MPLSPPTCRRNGDEWIFTWPDEAEEISHIILTIKNIRETSDGLQSWATIDYQSDGNLLHVHGPARFNMVVTRSRQELINHLVRRTKGSHVIDEATWMSVIEQVCRQVTSDVETGEPFICLADTGDVGAVPYLIDNFLPEDETTAIAAAGGKHKGWVAMYLAICYLTGHPLIGQHAININGTPNVLYLDWEENEKEQARRMHWLARGMRLETIPRGLIYRRMTRPITAEVNRLRAEIARQNIGLVIVDSLGAAAAAELNASETALATMTAIRTLSPATRFVIGHVSKADSRDSKRPTKLIGHIYFENYTRSYWEMQSDGGPTEYDIALIHQKVNVGRSMPTIAMRLTFDDNLHEAFIGPGDIRNIPAAVQHSSVEARIWHALEGGKMSHVQLTEELSETRNNILVAANRSRRILRLGKVGKEVWFGRAQTLDDG